MGYCIVDIYINAPYGIYTDEYRGFYVELCYTWIKILELLLFVLSMKIRQP